MNKKRITLGIIIITVLMLVGCKNVVKNSQADTATEEEKYEDTETVVSKQPDQANSQTSSQISNPSDYTNTYEDETHKEIQYGKLSFNMEMYHIVSHTRSGNTETYKCEIDKDETWLDTGMTIKVREIEKQDFADTKSIVSYLHDMSPNYEKVRIFNNVTDDSGIISLYSVTGGGLTNYLVYFKEDYYLIESDNRDLEIFLFKGDPEANYEGNKLKIECANSFTTNVNQTIFYSKDEFEKAEYDIIQGKDGTEYSAELSYDGEYEYHFTLKNETGETLLSLPTGDIYEGVKILDFNMDGYADIQLVEELGTMNTRHALYVWDESVKNFVKVKCKEMLSVIDVYDGYLLNFQKNSGDSGGIQKLVWDHNTLILESEEEYGSNESSSDLLEELFSNYENSLIEAIIGMTLQ